MGFEIFSDNVASNARVNRAIVYLGAPAEYRKRIHHLATPINKQNRLLTAETAAL
jgi:hypothetical protein